MENSEIRNRLAKISQQLNEVISALSEIDSDNAFQSRIAKQVITFTLFELIDSLHETETEIYNYLKER